MWIETVKDKQGNTAYKFVERYEHPYTGKTHKVSVTLDSQSPQAKKKATKILQEKIDKKIASTGYQKAEVITFGELAGRWYKSVESTVKEITYYQKGIYLNALLQRVDKAVLINRIDKRFVINTFEKIQSEENLSYNYLSEIKATFNQIMKYAVYLDYVENNPVSYLKLKNEKSTDDDVIDKFLTLEEAKKLWNAYYDEPRYCTIYGMMCEILFFTGLRVGELLAMQLKDYDGKNLHVQGTITFSKGNGRIKGTPKTKDSYRIVSLPERVIDLIDEIIFENNKKNPDDFLFTGKTGEVIKLSAFNRSLTTMCNRLKMSKKVTSHWFRHSHITMLAEMDIPLKTIMDRVGHSNPSVTLKIYNHVTSKQKEKVAEKLNKL